MEAVLSVRGLSKSYGEVQAVRNLSFTVQPGEIYGILGPNGAGKSTSLECILGTRKADSGEIELLGMNPVKERKILYQRVGVQFQDSAWQPGIKVGELCGYIASLYDNSGDWKEMLEFWDLQKRIHSPVSALSGGELQKLSILLACIHQPELVILDELTTGLDPIARRETWDLIGRLADGGATILLTSHFMDEVEALCNRGLILRDGEVIARGTMGELKNRGGGKSLEESYIRIVRGEE